MPISIAKQQDIPALVALLNSAYRGEASRKGWTTEADLLQGEQRTDNFTLAALMNEPGAQFLKYQAPEKGLGGCVFLHKKGSQLYLGMLSVSPDMQARGIGRKLMTAAAEHAQRNGCNSIFMKVISVRKELIAWYERQGFQDNGKREPFPQDDRFGTPTQPLEFIIMEKKIEPADFPF